MWRIILIVSVVCSLFLPNNLLSPEYVIVNVTIEGFRNTNGYCRLLVFDNSKGFPEDQEYAIFILNEIIEKHTIELNFELKPGNYALSILHDENANKKMDTTWFGKPKEGFGITNNPEVSYRAPTFKEASVYIDKDNNHFTIKLIYL